MAVVGSRLPRHPPGAERVLALVAAGLAVLAPASATGVGWLDALLRAAVAAGVVLAGARSRLTPLVLSALIVGVGGFDGRWGWVAGATAGAAVGAILAAVDTPLVRSGLALGITQAAFRLAWPTRSLATAGLAALALVLPVVGMAALDRRRAVRGRAVRGGAALAGLVVVGAALSGAGALWAKGALENGVRQARAGLVAAGSGRTDEAAREFGAARASFATARHRVDAWWTRPGVAIPVVARQRRALVTMAASGADIAGTGAKVAASTNPSQLRLASGRLPLDRISALAGPAADASAVLTRADDVLAGVRSPWLVPPVANRLGQLLDRVQRATAQARTVAVAARVAPGMLGADGPRRYFLAVQTPSEARGSGGFIGNFGQVTADGGTVHLDQVGRTATLNTSGTPAADRQLHAPDDFVRRYARFDPVELWQNVTLSPDFPTVAQVIEGLYPQSGGVPVDGVMAVDPYGLAAVLKAVGPVSVPAWPEPISAANAAHILLFDQYVRLAGDARVDFLGDVTAAVWQRLLTTSASVVDLAKALAPAVTEKHVLLASTRPTEQSALVELGAAGKMPAVNGDFLGVVTQNAGGNKIDWFLRRATSARVRIDPATGRVDSTVQVRLTNQAPATGLPPYIIGSVVTPPLPNGTNKLYLSVYSPWLLAGASIDGQPALLESELELGRHVYSTF
ncbi:MAG TPA: DUF4012 domain-containing protein, partial [Acidimicrobiales bacterium]|nr:DUF4012 domain-containing protein [Acidimicrobiales bacterium]